MLFIAGDNHGHFDHLIQAAKKHRPSAVISVGDITETAAGEAPNVPVHVEIAELLDMGIDWWWIPGNHDTDSAGQYDALFASCPDTNLDGRVVTLSDPDLGDVRVAGLGGIFRGQIWRPPAPPHYSSPEDFIRRMGQGNRWRKGLPLRHRSTIFPNIYQKLSEMKTDILITHEAPSYHPMGIQELELLAVTMGARQSFHGHHHDCLDYSSFAAKDGFRAYGVGYCGITAVRGFEAKDVQILRPGDFDAERGLRRQAWGAR